MAVTYPITQEVKTNARLLALAGNETRIRVFCLMYEQKKATVTEIADALGMSVASISHHLQLMKDNGLFDTERCGTSICYTLRKSSVTKHLKKIVC